MDIVFLATLAIMFIGGIFHGLIGFGFPLLVTPALSLFTDIKNAILATLFPTLFVNGTSILSIKNELKALKKFWILGLFVAIGSFVGTKILISYPYEFYKIILSSVMIIYLLKNKLHFNTNAKINLHSYSFMIFIGFISGVVGGITNVLVSILVIYILELKLEKNSSIVVMNFCFFSSKLTQIALFGLEGLIKTADFYPILLMLLFTFFGFFIGLRFRKEISTKFYEKILRFALWTLSIMLIFQYFMAIFYIN